MQDSSEADRATHSDLIAPSAVVEPSAVDNLSAEIDNSAEVDQSAEGDNSAEVDSSSVESATVGTVLSPPRVSSAPRNTSFSACGEIDAELCGKNGVLGVLTVDNKGLCLASKGEGGAKLAGVVATLALQAGQLQPDREQPVILVETKTRKYIIKKEETVTVAIIKSKTN